MTEKDKIALINKYKTLPTDQIRKLVTGGSILPDAYPILAAEARSRGLVAIDDLWIREQVDVLLTKCPFITRGQPFLLTPDILYKIANPKDQAIFLMNRYGLPFDEIPVYSHADIGQPGRVEIVKEFDTSALRLAAGQLVQSIKKDGTYSVLDMTDRRDPKLLLVSNPLPLKHTTIKLFLNQSYISTKEVMSAIIAHEISHIYLYYKGVQKFNTTAEFEDKIDEYITDVNTFIMGLGGVMLNGCCEKNRTYCSGDKIIEERSRLGYLSYKQMEVAQKELLSKVNI